MTESSFQQKIAELAAKIDAMPEPHRAQLKKMVERTQRRFESIKENCARSREALDDWRLAMKYLIFDSEAQARESSE